jgi:hypothetical protein
MTQVGGCNLITVFFCRYKLVAVESHPALRQKKGAASRLHLYKPNKRFVLSSVSGKRLVTGTEPSQVVHLAYLV